MGIVKSARGLPRFMADCGFWRHPKWVGSSLSEIGLFTACLSYCYEHETDGELPDPRALAVTLGLKQRDVRPALAALLARGSLEMFVKSARDVRDTSVSCLRIVHFEDHNPTRTEIAAHREKLTAAGKKGAEARWNPSDPQCDSHAVTNGRVEESREVTTRDEVEFNALWKDYPRKEARLAALKAYRARRAAGVSAADLARAVRNFIPAMARRDRDNIMQGSTFFGPNERWKDYLEPVHTNGQVAPGELGW